MNQIKKCFDDKYYPILIDEEGGSVSRLKNILDRVLLPYQFDAQEMRNKNVATIKITKEVIDSGDDPILTFNTTDAKKQITAK